MPWRHSQNSPGCTFSDTPQVCLPIHQISQKLLWPFSPLYVILWRNWNFNSAEPSGSREVSYRWLESCELELALWLLKQFVCTRNKP